MSKEELKEAILPKETLIEMELKCWYAYNLKNYQQQFHDYLSSSSKRYAEVFKEMCKDLLVGDKNYLESLTNFIEECRKFWLPIKLSHIPNNSFYHISIWFQFSLLFLNFIIDFFEFSILFNERNLEKSASEALML